MKKQSKAAKARAMMAQGKTIQQIVLALGVSRQYVYTLRHADRKRAERTAPATYDPNPMPVPPTTGGPKRGPGRPKGSKNKKVIVSATTDYQPPPSQPVVVSIEPYERKRTFTQRLVYLFTNK